jgi:hypothetical protein
MLLSPREPPTPTNSAPDARKSLWLDTVECGEKLVQKPGLACRYGYLAPNYDFATALKNLVKLAKDHGKSTVDDGIKIMQSMGGGNALEGAQTCRLLGDGDAGRCGVHSRILSGGDSMDGLNFLIHGLSDRFSVRQRLEVIRRLNIDGTVAGGLKNARQYGGGNCQGGLGSLHDLGEDREGNKDINTGVNTILELYPGGPGRIVDPQQALTYARQQYGTCIGPNGELLESCRLVTQTLLSTTRDAQGTVNGADAPRAIADLSPTRDIQEGNEILRRASVNHLLGEGVRNSLGMSDDGSFRDGAANIRLASNDGTTSDGVEQIRGFSNDGQSFPGAQTISVE